MAVRPGDIANLLPVSLISGPYAITQGQNLLLDGIASYDPDYVADSIAQYAWDLNGDAPSTCSAQRRTWTLPR